MKPQMVDVPAGGTFEMGDLTGGDRARYSSLLGLGGSKAPSWRLAMRALTPCQSIPLSSLKSLLTAILRAGEYSQTDVAHRLDVHRATISRYLSGQRARIPPRTVERFEDALFDLRPSMMSPVAWRAIVEGWALTRVHDEVDRLVARFGVRLAERFHTSIAAPNSPRHEEQPVPILRRMATR